MGFSIWDCVTANCVGWFDTEGKANEYIKSLGAIFADVGDLIVVEDEEEEA